VASKRTYGDRCGIARALDVIGERWALLVIRELLLGPKRFTDLRAGLPRIGPDVLSERLRDLERNGLVQRRELGPPAAARVYELTERGRGLEPVVLELGRWGSAAPVPSGDAPLGPDSTMIALKTMFDPAAAGSLDATYTVTLDQHPFAVAVAGGRLEIAHGAAADPDAELDTDPRTLVEILWRGASVTDAERSGSLTLDGSRSAARSLLRLFPFPRSA